MTNRPAITVDAHQNQYILYDANTNATDDGTIDLRLFEPRFLEQQQLITRTARGRGITYFFRHPHRQNDELILRHYLRGGLVGRVNREYYSWAGLKKTRAYREFSLLLSLYNQGLPVPKPYAARVIRKGLWYTADMITYALADTLTLVDLLAQEPLASNHWQQLGHTLANIHNHGVFHADLNAHNILLNTEKQCFVIDFDKGSLKDPQVKNWGESNLQRLLRSLEKEKSLHAKWFFTATDWQSLVSSYRETRLSSTLT